MLIGTDAIRESIKSLQDRVNHAKANILHNAEDIRYNHDGIKDNRDITNENNDKLNILDGRITDLEQGYGELKQKLSVDHETVVIMCHQYAYSESIPKECEPIISRLQKPSEYRWNFPE